MERFGFTVAALSVMACCLGEFARGDEAAALSELIDSQIDAKLKAEGIARAPQADDAEFLRRLYLDLHGVVPSTAQAAKFLNRRESAKRAELIEELLASSRYGENLGDIWRGRLASSIANERRPDAERFALWLAKRFNDNLGWDQIATELVTASGKMEENPAAHYLIEGRHPLGVTDLTDLTSRYFLGVRLNCAQCHDHPFVDWKKQDYWGMAAFFAQIQTPNRPKMVYVAGVQDDAKMTLASLKNSDTIEGLQIRPPTFLGGDELKIEKGKTYRASLAEWMTSLKNPYFARAMVNRTWHHFFGRGIVNPVDDMHSANAASHPELLDQLSERFAASGFDLKLLCRSIAGSKTYQQTSRPSKESKDADNEAKLFARMSIKSLTAPQLYDSFVSILGPPAKTAAIDARVGARIEFCQFFAGDGESDPTRYDRGIPHLLRLMNSPQFAGRSIAALVTRVATTGRSTEEVVDELFLTILSRRPTSAEQDLARDKVRTAESPQAFYRELAWALLMSSEFSLNH